MGILIVKSYADDKLLFLATYCGFNVSNSQLLSELLVHLITSKRIQSGYQGQCGESM